MLVDLQHVSLKLNNRLILEDVDLKVQSGEIVSIIGPNGAGKSSLIKVVLGLLPVSSGAVHLAKNLRIGYMPQSINIESLMPLTAARFLMLAPGATVTSSIEIAKDLRIDSYLHTPIQALSGGELQRVLLARALLNKPDLLVLDEPAQGVDINGQAELYNLIGKMRSKLNCGVLMVSHDLHLVIAGTDKVVCLNRHICCSGHPAAVTQHPEFIQLFGNSLAAGLAVYRHHHDHNHD